MKALNKKVFCIIAVFCMLFAFTTPAFAWTYSLNLTYPFAGSMKSTALYTKESGTSPYVNPNKTTISTAYILSPQPLSSIDATDTVYAATPGSRSFTYKSGYGGVGNKYCLSAYPDVTGTYSNYNVSGTWSN